MCLLHLTFWTFLPNNNTECCRAGHFLLVMEWPSGAMASCSCPALYCCQHHTPNLHHIPLSQEKIQIQYLKLLLGIACVLTLTQTTVNQGPSAARVACCNWEIGKNPVRFQFYRLKKIKKQKAKHIHTHIHTPNQMLWVWKRLRDFQNSAALRKSFAAWLLWWLILSAWWD